MKKEEGKRLAVVEWSCQMQSKLKVFGGACINYLQMDALLLRLLIDNHLGLFLADLWVDAFCLFSTGMKW